MIRPRLPCGFEAASFKPARHQPFHDYLDSGSKALNCQKEQVAKQTVGEWYHLRSVTIFQGLTSACRVTYLRLFLCDKRFCTVFRSALSWILLQSSVSPPVDGAEDGIATVSELAIGHRRGVATWCDRATASRYSV